MKNIFIALLLCTFIFNASAQDLIKGIVFDKDNKQALQGATITCGKNLTITESDGSFSIKKSENKILISHSSYTTIEVIIQENYILIELQKSTNTLQQVFVSANRDAVKRIHTPVSISNISTKTINETKATTIDQLVNKVSGVYMVNLGNEQHSMGIRQPIGTRSLFLYLEDGIPIRTTGVFNHNALMELNMAAVQNIEIIKGPGSSLYGGEAIGGVVNMITVAPTAVPVLKTSFQGNDIGYRRADIQTGFSKGKFGVNVSGYLANRKNGIMEYNDFNKEIITARIDYRFNNKTKLETGFTTMNYFNQMSGSVDSAMFANKTFTSSQTFTYRKAKTTRLRTSLFHEWNSNNKSSLQMVFRHNSLGQNPSYRVRDDYRRVGSSWIGKKDVAHGEINDNSFKSFVLMAQHRKNFNWLNANFIAGASVDISPNTSVANYIRIKKDTLINKYVSYTNRADSLLVNYKTNIYNYAAYGNFEFSPVKNLRVVASLRFDAFKYKFDNYLPANSVSGASDTVSSFNRFSPKIGFTFNFKKNRGVYANYSQGFVPPQVSELFRSVKVPSLSPSVFNNYELGGWFEIIKNKLTADISLYRLEGNNTIISVRFDDGTFGNANAGKTLHQGVELNFNATPVRDLQVRFGGSYNKHNFVQYVEKGVSFNGNEINSAPHWIHNFEFMFRPSKFLKGFRVAVEWQKMSEYFMNQNNSFSYKGFDIVNTRIAYQLKNVELWANVINTLDAYYAINSSSSNSGKTYTVGEPRNFNLGLSFDLGKYLKK